MKEHLQDLLKKQDKPIDPQLLIAYLQGNLSPAEAQQLEEQLAADDFEQEALEGLESVHNKSKLGPITASLHRDLQKKIRQKRRKRFTAWRAPDPLLYVVILILLLLMVLAYWIIHRTLAGG